MSPKQDTQRRRGIQASRAKLTRALTAAGLRTQAALAERIADREGLDSAPKDMVNRAFRELPVELQTLERIAAIDPKIHAFLNVTAEEALKQADAADAARTGGKAGVSRLVITRNAPRPGRLLTTKPSVCCRASKVAGNSRPEPRPEYTARDARRTVGPLPRVSPGRLRPAGRAEPAANPLAEP